MKKRAGDHVFSCEVRNCYAVRTDNASQSRSATIPLGAPRKKLLLSTRQEMFLFAFLTPDGQSGYRFFAFVHKITVEYSKKM